MILYSTVRRSTNRRISLIQAGQEGDQAREKGAGSPVIRPRTTDNLQRSALEILQGSLVYSNSASERGTDGIYSSDGNKTKSLIVYRSGNNGTDVNSLYVVICK